MSCVRQKTIVLAQGEDCLDLNPQNNSVGLKRITNNSAIPIDINLLAIERTIDPEHEPQFKCIYDNNITNFTNCSIEEDEFAHIYINTNELNQRYIIIFIKKTMAHTGKVGDLINIIHNTMDRLQRVDANILNDNNYIYKICIFRLYEKKLTAAKIIDTWQLKMDTKLKADFKRIKIHFNTGCLSSDDECLVISNNGRSLAFTFSPLSI